MSVVSFSLRVVSNFGTVHTAEGGVVLSGDQRCRRGGVHSKIQLLILEPQLTPRRLLRRFWLLSMFYGAHGQVTEDISKRSKIIPNEIFALGEYFYGREPLS